MNDLPFYDQLREGYEAYTVEMHIPTILFEALVQERLPESVKDRCVDHLRKCTICQASLACFEELLASGKVSGTDDTVSDDDVQKLGNRLVQRFKERFQNQVPPPEISEWHFAGPDDEEDNERGKTKDP